MSTKELQTRGLARVREIYQNRSQRAKELKKEGKKIIGYVCIYPPLEMLTAADLVPYRIAGDPDEPLTEADNYLITPMCGFIRSFFDLAAKGHYDFFDGVVFPHTCEGIEKTYDLWRYYFKPAYSHSIDVPHIITPASYDFFKYQLVTFKKSIEKYTGSAISDQRLREAIELHNENRRLMRELYDLRKPDPPLLTGTEMTQIIMASMSIPVEENNALLREVTQEVKERKERPEKKKARLLIWGTMLDSTAFVQLVEECGANVVIDDVCFGTRHYWTDVKRDGDLIDNFATRYLDNILCPRTYRQSPGIYGQDMENRFKYLRVAARDFNVNGVIQLVVRFCDTHGHEVPDIRDYLKEAGLPSLYLSYDYSLISMAPLRTRIEAFLELIGQ